MLTFEVNEFIERIDEMLRLVLEEGETIEITNRGEIIARMEQVRKQRQADTRGHSATWNDLERISAEISAYWPEGLRAVDAVRDVRREL
jgi:antitoxin (DNA-binding transcriptional repressor) of toxin-antitoxin stability system